MHQPSSSGQEAGAALPNGQKHKGKAAASKQASGSSGAHALVPKQKKGKKAKLAIEASSEPLPASQAAVKKTKRKKPSDEDIFAPVEDYEQMLRDDAPLQSVSRKGSKGRTKGRAQKADDAELADPDEEYGWG